MKSAKCPCCRTGPIGRLEMKDGDHRLIAPDVRKCPPTMQIMEAFFELAHLKINRVMFIKQARQFENSEAFVFKKFNLDFHVCSCSEECNCSHMITSYYDFQAWFDNIPTSQKHPSLTVAKLRNLPFAYFTKQTTKRVLSLVAVQQFKCKHSNV